MTEATLRSRVLHGLEPCEMLGRRVVGFVVCRQEGGNEGGKKEGTKEVARVVRMCVK